MIFRMWLFVGIAFLTGAAAADDDSPVIRDDTDEALHWLVDQGDELLGGTRTDDNKSSSTLRLRVEDSASRNFQEEPKFHLHLNTKIGILERWQKEAQTWIKNEVDEIRGKEHKTPGKHSGAQEKPTPPRPPPNPWRFSFEKHVTVARHPDFWAHLRTRRDFHAAHLFHSFSIQAGWSLRSKWQTLSSFDSNLRLARYWTMGFGNALDWKISERSFGTSHGPSVTYIPGPHQAASLSAGLSTAVNRGWAAESYTVGAHYGCNAWKRWVFLQAGTSLVFARGYRFKGDPGVSGSIEMVF